MANSEQMKYILFYIAIGVGIYFLFFHKTEKFTIPSAASQCSLIKDSNKEVKNEVVSKCGNFDAPGTRDNINQRSECYTLTGQDITSELDMNSWCQLGKDDMEILDAATQNIADTETQETTGYDTKLFSSF